MEFKLYQEILKKIKLDNVSDRIEVHLYTWGEPLLHPEIAKFVSTTKEMGLYCGISSNLNLEKNLKQVIKARPDFFRISLSGFYQNQYKLTHKRGDIRIVKSNMYKLRSMLDQYKTGTNVQVLYHVYNHNAGDDLAMMLKLCEELEFNFDPVWAFYMPLEKSLDYFNGKVTSEDKNTIEMLAMDPLDVSKAARSNRNSDCMLRKNQVPLNVDGSVQLCCATFDKAYVVAPSFIDTSHEDLQKLRYSNKMCNPCMEKGQHIYFTYDVGKKLDQLGEKCLSKNNAKFVFKQFSEPRLKLRLDHESDAISLPRAPKKRKKKVLRYLIDKLSHK